MIRQQLSAVFSGECSVHGSTSYKVLFPGLLIGCMRMSFLVRHIISLFFLDCTIGSNLATLATLCRKQHLPVKAHFRLCLPQHKPVPASCANILSGLKCLAMALDSELQG